jgi:Transglycosylase SLT domain/SPOR domain
MPRKSGKMRHALSACALWIGVACGIAAAEPTAPATESVHEALCRLIGTAAHAHGVPDDFLTNLIWRESSFRTGVVSRAGAQGVAQFMPGTAAERGLADPFDPEQAIPHAARLIAELRARFGNLGLAAAAYNAGAGRVEKWLAKEIGLPAETRNFVVAVTGRSADDWAAIGKGEATGDAPRASPPRSCGMIIAALRRPGAAVEPMTREAGEGAPDAPFAPWGVQLAGDFSKERALASFGRARQRYAGAIGDARPMVIGTRLRSRGTRTFYRVRLPAESRGAADQLCGRIRSAGGACIVLRS